MNGFIVMCPGCKNPIGKQFSLTVRMAIEELEEHYGECLPLQSVVEFMGMMIRRQNEALK